MLVVPAGFAAAPACESAASDPDGDGWGWENEASCIVVGGAGDANTAPVHPVCQRESDPDGDGWGWENNLSCRMQGATQTVQKPASAVHPDCKRDDSDPDGDGYGWENGASCIADKTSHKSAASHAQASANRVIPPSLPRCASMRSDPDGDGLGWEDNDLCASGAGLAVCDDGATDPDRDGYGLQSGKTCAISDRSAERPTTVDSSQLARLADITDVVLVTGQSNVLGSMTAFDARLDLPHERVFAWTDEGWQTAELHQVWDRNGHPGNFSAQDPKRQPYNNFAFHFGRELARLAPDAVPAFIVASAPGKGIAHWDRGGPFYRELSDKVQAALRALPHRDSIDGVLWHQGETDWQFHGTSDPFASGIAAGSPDYRQYYPLKLQSLIGDLRAEPWSSGRQMVFICGETRRAEGVNRHLMALNSDADPLTGCVAASDLPARDDDQGGSHFSAVGLRALGIRYARLYRDMRPN